MKKFQFRNFVRMSMLVLSILFGFLTLQNVALANDPPPCNWDGGCDSVIDEWATENWDKTAYVYTTEEIPWAGCKPVGDTKNNVETRKFKCPVPEASSAIKSVISTMIQYVVFIATLCGVLMLAVWGIMYSIGGATDEGKVKAKKFIVSSIAGLILLFFVSAILFLVAPWVYS